MAIIWSREEGRKGERENRDLERHCWAKETLAGCKCLPEE